VTDNPGEKLDDFLLECDGITKVIPPPQSSSASRFTAGGFGFLTFTQCDVRPER
jgi:hypothetical protein